MCVILTRCLHDILCLYSVCTHIHLCQENDIKFIMGKYVVLFEMDAILKLRGTHSQNVWVD